MHPLLRDRPIEMVPISSIRPYRKNPRKHSAKQIEQVVQSIRRFGFRGAIWTEPDGTIIVGHARWQAAKSIGMRVLPVIVYGDLSDDEVRALRIADNKLVENADWDLDLLKVEFGDLIVTSQDVEMTDTGFEMGEIDAILAEPDVKKGGSVEVDPTDLGGPAIAKPGDLFECGSHKLLCGDAREGNAYSQLMDGLAASAAITDPPYNVRITNNVSSTGHHGEFAMGSGEMDRTAFEAFLVQYLGLTAVYCRPGALIYVFIDWRHVHQLIEAGQSEVGSAINVVVWDKGTGGMGSLYRSAHEFICIFRNGKKAHTNNVQLGRFGRNRTNVWRYPGVNSFGKGRQRALAMHPTVKPTAMIADAILDCTDRNDIVLDPFAGSGTILIAAHRTGRRARAMEIDPTYVDVALRRFRRETGIEPVHVASGLTLSELERRAADAEPHAVRDAGPTS